MTTEVKTAKYATESSGHWYQQDGLLVESVTLKNGKQAKPSLRHARELQLAPGVTTILKEAAAPGLERWKINQAVLAAMTLPRIDGETSDEFLARVSKDAAEHGKQAAEEGTRIHAAIESFYRGDACDPDDPTYKMHVEGVRDLLNAHCGDQPSPWLPEAACVSPLGYATKSDLHSHDWVIDFKGKDGDQSELDAMKTFDQHDMQLAATRAALEPQLKSHPRCAIVFVSRTHPGACSFAEIPEPKLVRGLAMFDALLTYWQTRNNYCPNWATGAF